MPHDEIKSTFLVAQMDCPSEEQLIRTALSDAPVHRLDFDIPKRGLVVFHDGDAASILSRLQTLGLGAELVASAPTSSAEAAADPSAKDQTRVLRLVLGINAAMFVAEFIAGWLAESTGLLADSLDMLADALVYGLSLWAVGRATSFQRTAASVSGWLQLLLAFGVLGEVARRALMGSAPEPPTIIGVAAIALVANVICMLALARHRDGGVHMQASWIFTTNDVIANAGVIAAGALVSWTSSPIPDLVAGTLIGLLVLRGALRILKLAKPSVEAG